MRIFSIGGIAGVLMATVFNVGAVAQVTLDRGEGMFDTRSVAGTAREAYRQGITAYRERWYDLALPALKRAADMGVLGALMPLGDMYAQAKGVDRSDAKAFEYYQRIVDIYYEGYPTRYYQVGPFHPLANYFARGFVALAKYHRSGISKIGLNPDNRRAADLFRKAASDFGDPIAQYHLARLHLVGEGVPRNAMRAINWLKNAANKRHAPSQALLGQILWEGDYVKAKPVRAIALLTLARENARREDREWIDQLYQSIVLKSDPDQRTRAKKLVANWVRRIGGPMPKMSGDDVATKPGRAVPTKRADETLPWKSPTVTKKLQAGQIPQGRSGTNRAAGGAVTQPDSGFSLRQQEFTRPSNGIAKGSGVGADSLRAIGAQMPAGM